jgi:tripartite-type tricarboxylate transporter receptor subunit TctC
VIDFTHPQGGEMRRQHRVVDGRIAGGCRLPNAALLQRKAKRSAGFIPGGGPQFLDRASSALTRVWQLDEIAHCAAPQAGYDCWATIMPREQSMSVITRRRLIQGVAAAGLAAADKRAARAQGEGAWPNRPVRFVVPLAPGGGIDFIARTVGEYVSRHIGQQVVVENRTGAGGTLGMDMAMRSPPDGYTVLITNDNAASAPHILGLAYDYTKELVPVINLAWQPQVLAAHPSLGVTSLAQLIEYAKANPGLGYATSGVGTNQHILGEWFKRESGLKLDHVPYRGAGQAINDLIAGHVRIALLGPTATVPHYQADKLRLLAQSSVKRAKVLPEVPTLEEAGFKGLVLEAWYAAFVPKGTPPAIVERLNSEMGKALADPAMQENFTRGSMEPTGGSADELGKLARADSEKYERLVRELNLKTN